MPYSKEEIVNVENDVLSNRLHDMDTGGDEDTAVSSSIEKELDDDMCPDTKVNDSFSLFDFPTNGGGDDVFSQLAVKEKYLLIAAEAGKELLERNYQLTKLNEKQKADYSAIVEQLRQEAHTLRRKLLQREEVNESRMQDLNKDMDTVREQLASVQQESFILGKLNRGRIEEMTAQNELLIGQLDQVKNRNRDLSFQVNTLRKRIEGRRSQNGVQDAESPNSDYDDMRYLREQNYKLVQQMHCLEDTIAECVIDKENALQECEAAKLKAIHLNQELSEMKQKVMVCQEELDESKHSNSQLREQLEEYIVKASVTGPRVANKSLYDELEFTLSETDLNLATKLQGSTPMNVFKPSATSSHHGFNNLKRRRNFSGEESSDADNDGEEEEYVIQNGILSFNKDTSCTEMETLDSKEVGKVVLDCYKKLLHLHNQLVKYVESEFLDCNIFTFEKNSNTESVAMGAPSDLETLLEAVQFLIQRILFHELSETNDDNKKSEQRNNSNNNLVTASTESEYQKDILLLEEQITQLNEKLNESRKEGEKLKKEIYGLKGALRGKEDEVTTLSQKADFGERELKNLKEERALLLSTASIEDTLKKSIHDRQEALQRENESLLELDQMRSDMKKLNDQLVDAIQQKVELSEQLDDWQMDMAAMIERQLSSKLKVDNKKGRRRHFFNTRWNWGVSKPPATK